MAHQDIETLDKPFNLHVLVCTNTRKPGEKQSCGPMGSDLIRGELKGWLREEIISRPKIAKQIRARVNGSGCIDFCSKGIAMAIYPEGEFLLQVQNTPEHLEAIKVKLRAYLDRFEAQADF